jgi:hypothetical protein
VRRGSAGAADRGLQYVERGGPPFAPEVAEQPTANYAPEIDPSNFVKEVDNPYFPLEPDTTWVY